VWLAKVAERQMIRPSFASSLGWVLVARIRANAFASGICPLNMRLAPLAPIPGDSQPRQARKPHFVKVDMMPDRSSAPGRL
jgi:hypothetical protein